MSARPGRIKADAARSTCRIPRHYTIKTTPEFSALKAQLTEEIRVEAIRAAAVDLIADPAGVVVSLPPFCCQRHASAQIASSPRVARQPSRFPAPAPDRRSSWRRRRAAAVPACA